MQEKHPELHEGLATPTQTIAAQALILMAAAHPLESRTIDALADTWVRTDNRLSNVTPLQAAVLAAARHQPLPANLIEYSFTRLEAPSGEDGIPNFGALAVLSNNIRFLPPTSRKRYSKWLEAHAAQNQMTEEIHTAIGNLLSVDPTPRPELLQILVDRLSPETYFPAPLDYRGGTIIYSSGDEAAIALGRALQSHRLGSDIEERLVSFAIGRQDIAERQIIIDGLAKQWYPLSIEPKDIESRLRIATASSARRLLEIEVACSRLLGLSSSDRASALSELLGIWQRDSEPEIRSAIAKIIARSQWPRYGDMTMCSGG